MSSALESERCRRRWSSASLFLFLFFFPSTPNTQTHPTQSFLFLIVFQAGDALIQLYHNFIPDFETKINLLKLAHFAVIVSRQYSEKEAAINHLEGVIEKLRATREQRIEEPILYIKTQTAILNLSKVTKKSARSFYKMGRVPLTA